VTVTAAPDTVKTHRPTRHRVRRWVIALVVLALLLAGADVGAGWYFSDELLNVAHATYPERVLAVSGSTVTLRRNANSVRPIVYGLSWPSGHAVLDASVRVSGDRVERHIVSGTVPGGVRAALDWDVYAGDPRTARGLQYTDVTITDALGTFPAWFVPQSGAVTNTTWVIAIHGRAGARTEALRALPAIAALGLPTLDLTYRNDDGAPGSRDHWYHLGDTEWQEVAAAVTYALSHGATNVVLYGWSMGGAIALTAVRRMPRADVSHVVGVVLDSPVVSWSKTLDRQAANRHVPGFVTWTAERIAERRADLKFSDFDQGAAPLPDIPMLLYVDLADSTVPVAPALAFAAARPHQVRLVTTAGGEHTGSWNANPDAYDAALRAFLTRTAP
jgi:uncharacterized protein